MCIHITFNIKILYIWYNYVRIIIKNIYNYAYRIVQRTVKFKYLDEILTPNGNGKDSEEKNEKDGNGVYTVPWYSQIQIHFLPDKNDYCTHRNASMLWDYLFWETGQNRRYFDWGKRFPQDDLRTKESVRWLYLSTWRPTRTCMRGSKIFPPQCERGSPFTDSWRK